MTHPAPPAELPPIDRLLAIMARLRDRKDGCPWDVEQTFATIAPYTVEEAYEVADAIERNDLADQKDELGDLLFQVVFHAHLASEEGLFDLRGVADAVERKLVARHPHVFGDAVATSPDAVARRWEDLKLAEKGRTSVLDGIPEALPALSLMAKVRRKALAAGVAMPERAALVERVHDALAALPDPSAVPDDATIGHDADEPREVADRAKRAPDRRGGRGVDPEQALRARARALATDVRNAEAGRNPDPGGPAG